MKSIGIHRNPLTSKTDLGLIGVKNSLGNLNTFLLRMCPAFLRKATLSLGRHGRPRDAYGRHWAGHERPRDVRGRLRDAQGRLRDAYMGVPPWKAFGNLPQASDLQECSWKAPGDSRNHSRSSWEAPQSNRIPGISICRALES